jgi:hypothetical protein
MVLLACKKEEDPSSTMDLEVRYLVDQQELVMDTMMFMLPEGIPFSVSRLEWYLSDLYLYADGRRTDVRFIQYFNAQQELALHLEDVPIGDFDSLVMHIGLPADKNISYSLGSAAQHIGMAWPDNMGGGYHFMKLEGHSVEGESNFGYAIHLGNNDYYVRNKVAENVRIDAGGFQGELHFRILEWYQNPHEYSLIEDGTYTMGVDSLMDIVAQNGRDVLTLNP